MYLSSKLVIDSTMIMKYINKPDSRWCLFSVKQLTSGIEESSSPLKCVHFISWEHLTFQWVDRGSFSYRTMWVHNPAGYLDVHHLSTGDSKRKPWFFYYFVFCCLNWFCTDDFCGHIPDSIISRLLYAILLVCVVLRHKEALIILPAVG